MQKLQKKIDTDTLLDSEDIKAITECDKEAAEGTLTPLDNIIKERSDVNVRRRSR